MVKRSIVPYRAQDVMFSRVLLRGSQNHNNIDCKNHSKCKDQMHHNESGQPDLRNLATEKNYEGCYIRGVCAPDKIGNVKNIPSKNGCVSTS
jgi:hypothetical protein